jgi:purine-cytosine permease-like protein
LKIKLMLEIMPKINQVINYIIIGTILRCLFFQNFGAKFILTKFYRSKNSLKILQINLMFIL